MVDIQYLLFYSYPILTFADNYIHLNLYIGI